MNRYIGYGLALLLAALAAGLLLDAGSVRHIASDVTSDQRPGAVPLQQRPSPEQPRPGTARLASRLALGERFASFDELLSDQQAAGFIRVGSFGNHWPATVTEIITDRDEIKFVRRDGTPHHYTGFAGYAMKVVRLMAGEQETVVVFRAREKF